MKVIHYTQAQSRLFDSEPAKGVTGRVVIGKNDGAQNFCMRIFELSPEGHTPLHKHEWEHEIFIHSGKGNVYREGQWVPVSEGNVIFIPGNEEHQLKNVGEGTLVFVCSIPSGAPEL